MGAAAQPSGRRVAGSTGPGARWTRATPRAARAAPPWGTSTERGSSQQAAQALGLGQRQHRPQGVRLARPRPPGQDRHGRDERHPHASLLLRRQPHPVLARQPAEGHGPVDLPKDAPGRSPDRRLRQAAQPAGQPGLHRGMATIPAFSGHLPALTDAGFRQLSGPDGCRLLVVNARGSVREAIAHESACSRSAAGIPPPTHA